MVKILLHLLKERENILHLSSTIRRVALQFFVVGGVCSHMPASGPQTALPHRPSSSPVSLGIELQSISLSELQLGVDDV